MTIQHVTFVLERSLARNGERLVLLSLANHADGADECWPSHACIAHEAGLSVDQVRRCLRQLEEDGRIDRVVNAAPDDRIPRDRRPNLYRLAMAVERPSWRTLRDGGAESAHPRGCGIRGDGGAESPRAGVRNPPTKTPVETPVKKDVARKRATTTLPASFEVDDAMRAWAREKAPRVNVEVETEVFVDYWQGRGKTMRDWVATWRNWMRRAAKELPPGVGDGRGSVARAVAGRNGTACPECQDVGLVLDDDGTAHPCACRRAS